MTKFPPSLNQQRVLLCREQPKLHQRAVVRHHPLLRNYTTDTNLNNSFGALKWLDCSAFGFVPGQCYFLAIYIHTTIFILDAANFRETKHVLVGWYDTVRYGIVPYGTVPYQTVPNHTVRTYGRTVASFEGLIGIIHKLRITFIKHKLTTKWESEHDIRKRYGVVQVQVQYHTDIRHTVRYCTVDWYLRV